MIKSKAEFVVAAPKGYKVRFFLGGIYAISPDGAALMLNEKTRKWEEVYAGWPIDNQVIERTSDKENL
jgi:hypothetical protein